MSIGLSALDAGPANHLAIGASSGGAAQVTATLAPSAGKTAYLTGFEVSGLGATSGSNIAITVSGLGSANATFTYEMAVVSGATTINPVFQVEFGTPIAGTPPAASGVAGTSIVVTVPSFGTGNTASYVNAHGFQM